MKEVKKALLVLGSFVATSSCFATGVLPSCYNIRPLQAPTASAPAVELFVVMDQTTVLDDLLKQAVANQVRPFLKGGNGFSVLVFSAFMQGKYTQVLTSGQLDQPLQPSERNDISKPVLAKFDRCMSSQPALASQAVGAALRAGFAGTNGAIAKSSILASLKDISAKVRQSPAKEKVVLLVSDMLENSSLTSFYANQAVRKINPQQELALVIKHQFLGDFGGARLYVMGAGLLNHIDQNSKAQYRDPQTMQALANFWRGYFEQSRANLLEFGEPALLNQIK